MRAAIAVSALCLALSSSVAHAQQARGAFELRDEPHAGVPFHLDAVIEGQAQYTRQGGDEDTAANHRPGRDAADAQDA